MLPVLEMRQERGIDPSVPFVTYSLWDTSNQCLIDKWQIEDHYDSLNMEKDLKILGFNL